MDITFQSGEFYNQSSDFLNILGGFVGVVISSVISVWIYRASVNNDREKEEAKRIVEIKRFQKAYFLQLQNAIESIKKQIVDYHSFVEWVSKEPFAQLGIGQRTHTELKRLSLTSTIDLVTLFQHLDLPTEDYTKTVNSIDFLMVIIERIADDWTRNVSTYEKLANKLIQIRNEILQEITDYISLRQKTSTEYLKESLVAFLNSQIHEYYSNTDGRPNVEYDYKKLIIPVKNTLLDNFRNEEVSMSLLKKTKMGGDIVFSIRDFNTTFANNISIVISKIEESNTELEKVLNKIERKM